MLGTHAEATTRDFPSLQILPNRVKNQKCQYYIKMLLSSVLHVKKQFLTKFSEFCSHIRCLQKALPLELELQDTAGNNDEVIRKFFQYYHCDMDPGYHTVRDCQKQSTMSVVFPFNILSAGFTLQTISPDGHRI